jgi:23S rRNA pseudouridine1911/1915/1917 synthase
MRTDTFLGAEQYLVTHEVPSGYDGIRLDAFLKERYRRRSRETLKRAISAGVISILRNQSPHLTLGKLKPSLPLFAGDQVQVLSEKKPEPEVCFDYRVIFEDETLLVIDKPPNLPVHPAGRYFFNTLLVHLKTHGHKDPLRAEREFFLVHRIDKETSGVLVLAKDKEVCTHLTRQFSERKTEKRYLAIAHGLTPEEFKIDLAMKRAGDSIIDVKMKVAPESEGGQHALTYFKRLSTHGKYSLVECDIRTGRQHQIRVHLEVAGHPIVGDKLYGRLEEDAVRFYERKWISPEAEAQLILPRHALHAAMIRFENPLTGKMMEFRSELPADLRAFLASQG